MMWDDSWCTALKKREQEGLLRTLHHENKVALDFTSNEYLCLSSHPDVIEGAIQAVKQYGAGKCSSRLISGGYALLDQLECELACWYGKEAALLFPSGYQASVAFLSALLSPDSCVIADKYIHKSLLDGIKLSRAKLFRYPHGDLQAMEALLQKYHTKFSQIVCVTESVFSMHGTAIDLDAFCAIAARYGALSCVDDAHGFGVLYQNEKTRLQACDIVITTLSKSLGGQGGAILGQKSFIQYLVNFASGFIYTTSLSPAIVGGALSALRLLPSLTKEREHLWALIDRFRQRTSSSSTTQIQPLFFASSQEACRAQAFVRQQNIAVVAIRPPTVPQNQALLRFSLSTGHSLDSLERLFSTLRAFV